MWSAPDDILLAGYATGDHEAATAFIRRHQRRVYGLALSIVVDAALAEDIAQEAFSRAWRHASTYDPRRGSVVTWLLTITRNLAIDAARIRRARPVDPDVLSALDLEASASSQSDPVAAAELGEDAVRLKGALACLPETQRRALILAGLCGRTAQEISDTEGIPLGTAKTRIRAGLIKMRELLGVELDEPGVNEP